METAALAMSGVDPKLHAIEAREMRKEVPSFRVGDTVRVHYQIHEGDKERVQVFEGIVTRKTRGGLRSMFTVRKVSYGVGVERTFPLHSPRIDAIELRAEGKVRRARLFFLRKLAGKAARIEEA